MGHIQDFESGLRERLATGNTEALVTWAKEQVLQSYRNGLRTRASAGKDGARFAGRYARAKKPSVQEE